MLGGVSTATVALACPPLAEAVTAVLPPESALTGIATLVCPGPNPTLAGTLATAGSAFATLRVPEAVGAGARVAVSVPLEPMLSASGSGARDTGLGIATVNTVIVIRVPFAPATESAIVSLASSVNTRSTLVTPPAKSERE
jgi:hypothetical protein